MWFAINSELAEQNPYLLDVILKRNDELMCHGWNMDSLHYGGQEQTAEAELVAKTIKMVDNSEYKRLQAPIGTKVSHKAFGRERRYPLVNKWSIKG